MMHDEIVGLIDDTAAESGRGSRAEATTVDILT